MLHIVPGETMGNRGDSETGKIRKEREKDRQKEKRLETGRQEDR